jgi:hypothetical protein
MEYLNMRVCVCVCVCVCVFVSTYVQCAPSHDPETLQFSHANVGVTFLPPNTTSVLHCMLLLKIFKKCHAQFPEHGQTDLT